MKTPEEIKNGLECCTLHDGEMYVDCSHCPYYLTCTHCDIEMHKNALAYIQQLESRLAQAERERDALYFDLANMPNACDVCAHGVQDDGDCDELFGHNNGCEFKWRGVVPENTKEDEDG